MSGSNSTPYELIWRSPPARMYTKEPGGVVVRVTYKAFTPPPDYTPRTYVKLYAQVRERFGWRQGIAQHCLCELHYRGKVLRQDTEAHVAPLIDICVIRFGLTVRKVDWWGVNGERRGRDELA